jgi:HSP20 family molecular chaperone IbpA
MWSKTVTEYSSSRKLRNTYSLNDSKEYETISNSDSMKSEAATSENKAYYTELNSSDGTSKTLVYIIEFKVGEFKLNEINFKINESNKLTVIGQNNVLLSEQDYLKRNFKREFNLPKDLDLNSIKADLNTQTREYKLTFLVNNNNNNTSNLVEKETAKYQQQSNKIETNLLEIKEAAKIQQSISQSNKTIESNLVEKELVKIEPIKFTNIAIDRVKTTPNNETSQLLSILENIGSIKEAKESTAEFEINLGHQLKSGEIKFEVPNPQTLIVKCTKLWTDSLGSYNLELRREIKIPNGSNLNKMVHDLNIQTGVLIIRIPIF